MSSSSKMTLVYYYVPQDNDDVEYPNVFGIMTPRHKLTLKHIIDNFPLSGTYIFRFKANHAGTLVWQDFNPEVISSKQAEQVVMPIVPTYQDRVIVKATRVSWENRNPFDYLTKMKVGSMVANSSGVKNGGSTSNKQSSQQSQQSKNKVSSSAQTFNKPSKTAANSTKAKSTPIDQDLLSSTPTPTKQKNVPRQIQQNLIMSPEQSSKNPQKQQSDLLTGVEDLSFPSSENKKKSLGQNILD